MDLPMIVLRLIHFTAGAAWVGGAVYFNLLLVPALRSMDGRTAHDVTTRVRRLMGPVFGALAALTIGSGGAMIALLQTADLSTGWWTSMVIGIATSVLTLAIAFGPEMRALRAVDRLRASEGDSGSERDGSTLQGAAERAVLFGRVATAFALVSLATMAVARFV